jgi:hypothetical protein
MEADAMTQHELPAGLALTDCAMALDGGSIFLQGVDQAGAEVRLYLDWAIDSQRKGTTQLYANEMPVPRGSQEESRWLALVRGAAVRVTPDPEGAHGTSVSQNRIVLAEGVGAYLDAIDAGPEAAVTCLAGRLVSLVSSATYQDAHPPPPQSPPVDRVRLWVSQGRRMEAIKAYREEHPDVGIAAARIVVDALAKEMELAARRCT